MTISRFPHGISSFGIPQLGSGALTTTGNVFFVDDSGSDSNDGLSPEHPFSTLDYAIGRCTASHGDIIIVMPGHAETAPAAGVLLDQAGISIIGLGQGRARPCITAHASAAVDLIAVSGANCYIENIRLVGGAAGTTALVDAGAADLTVVNCVLEHGAAPTIAFTIPAAGLRTTIKGCTFRGTANGPATGIKLEAAAASDLMVQDCDFLYFTATGLDTAGISSAFSNKDVLVSRCRFVGMNTTAISFTSSANGLIEYCTAASYASTTVAEIFDPGDAGIIECYAAGEGIDKSGSRIPATTATP